MEQEVREQTQDLSQAPELWSDRRARGITTRIVVEATLRLETPAHFGNGEQGDFVDMPLLTDAVFGRPMITGSSLAGAMRAYLEAREHGSALKQAGVEEAPSGSKEASSSNRKSDATSLLFGDTAREEGGGEDSPLIVDDAICEDGGEIEIRSGVEIELATGTAKEQHLYTREVWKAGTEFPLRFELLHATMRQVGGRQRKRSEDHKTRLIRAFVTALSGLTEGEITLGARKTRGYGKVSVRDWRFRCYDLTRPADLIDWLRRRDEVLPDGQEFPEFKKALFEKTKMPENLELVEDKRCFFGLETELEIPDSILIRGLSANPSETADDVYMSRGLFGSGNTSIPVIPGTSLAGVLRKQAARIAGVFVHDEESLNAWLDDLFGRDVHRDSNDPEQRQPRASRLHVHESEIEEGRGDLLQRRVAIDSFTGGAADALLFSQRPWFGGKTKLRCDIVNPDDRDIGLLLMLMKDLWTGFLPVGGNTSVGRGRLQGRSATLIHRDKERGKRIWRIVQESKDSPVRVEWKDESEHSSNADARVELEHFSNALKNPPATGSDDVTL